MFAGVDAGRGSQRMSTSAHCSVAICVRFFFTSHESARSSCSLPGLRRPFRGVRGSWSFRLCGGLPRDVAILGDRRPVLSCIAHLCEGIRAGRQTGCLSLCRIQKENIFFSTSRRPPSALLFLRLQQQRFLFTELFLNYSSISCACVRDYVQVAPGGAENTH